MSSRDVNATDFKINTGYRLPVSLVTRIRQLAAEEGKGVWPCHVAERLLRRGLELDEHSSRDSRDIEMA